MEISLDHLPESVAELVGVVGVTAALAIVEERGGVRMYTPVKADPDHWLAKLIGMVALERLVEYYQGEEIELPRCVEAMRAAKDMVIVAEHEAGASNADLARRYGYTERGIKKLRRRVGSVSTSPQTDLFDSGERH